MPKQESNIAIYLDFENLAISAIEVYRGIEKPLRVAPIIKFAESKGQVRIKKVYADWSKKKFAQYQRMLIAEGFELIHLPETNLLGKNGSDMRLVIDVMGQLQDHPHIDTLIIGSGDSDFIPLIQHMQNRDKEVIVIGFEHSVSEMVKNYCSEFKSLADIIGPVTESPAVAQRPAARGLSRPPRNTTRSPRASRPKETPPPKDGRSLVLRYLKKHRPQGPVALSVFKQDLLVMEPDFSERELGFNSFKKFVKSLKGDLVSKLEKVDKRWLIHFDLSSGQQESARSKAQPERRRTAVSPKEKEEEKPQGPAKDSPEFKAARELVKRLIREREGSALPLARLKPHLQNLDPGFSEKKLGYRYFKNFTEDLMGDLIEKVEKEGHTIMVYFRQLNGQPQPEADGEEKKPPMAKEALPEEKTRQEPREENQQPRTREKSAPRTARGRKPADTTREKSPRRQQPDASEERTVKKSESPVKKEAQQYLAGELHYNSRQPERIKMAAAIIEGFGMYPIMTLEQIKTFVRERSGIKASEDTFRQYVQILKEAGAFAPSPGEGNLAKRLLTLTEGNRDADSIDSLYIERIGQMAKDRFPALSTDELLDILF